jgi:hypothetical protein
MERRTGTYRMTAHSRWGSALQPMSQIAISRVQKAGVLILHGDPPSAGALADRGGLYRR